MGPSGSSRTRASSSSTTSSSTWALRERWPIAESTPRGRACSPGFVDSHTHLVFAGDRAEEFTARMAGAPYDGGRDQGDDRGDPGHERPTNSTGWCVCGWTRRHRAGITTIEIKSGYGLNVADEARRLRRCTPHTTSRRSSALTCCRAEYVGRADDYVHLVCNDMLDASRPIARGSTSSARWGPSTPTSVGRCSTRAEPRGWGCGSTATSWDTARVSARRRDGVCLRRPLHLSDRRRHRRARRERHGRDVPARDRLLAPASHIPMHGA